MISIRIRKCRCFLILVITIVLLTPSISVTTNNVNNVAKERNTSTISSHSTTRHQAIIDYIQALYSPEEGTFYAWLEDTPTDPRIGSYRHISNVYDPYIILKQLGSIDAFDWSNSTDFIESLANVNPSSTYYNLVNDTYRSPPSAADFYHMIELFSDFGLGDYIHENEIAEYIAGCQTSNGGFRFYPFNEDPAGMIPTCFALQALESIGRLSAINTTAALSYVRSCYNNDGGFSEVPATEFPDIESIPDMVPLGLFCLDILGRPDLIRVQNTTDYLLQYFDEKGTTSGGTLVNTERFVWSLYTLGTIDQINVSQMLSWVISCQTTFNGAFLPTPTSDSESERLEWIRAAVHILYLCDSIDLLDEAITVAEYPEYHIPQWYIDYINEHFGTTTTTGNRPFPVWPNIDVITILLAISPYIGVILLISLPSAYIVLTKRKKRAERGENQTRRKKMKS